MRVRLFILQMFLLQFIATFCIFGLVSWTIIATQIKNNQELRVELKQEVKMLRSNLVKYNIAVKQLNKAVFRIQVEELMALKTVTDFIKQVTSTKEIPVQVLPPEEYKKWKEELEID